MIALVIDTETGGLTADKSVLSVGAVVYNIETDEVIDGFYCLVKNDEYHVTDQAMAVNKLSLSDCDANGLAHQEIIDKLLDLYVKHGCSYLAGQNPEFDIKMLASQIFKCDREEFIANFTYRVINSQTIGHMITPPIMGGLQKLVKAIKVDVALFEKECSAFSKGSKGYHTALFDAWCSAKCLGKFKKAVKEITTW